MTISSSVPVVLEERLTISKIIGHGTHLPSNRNSHFPVYKLDDDRSIILKTNADLIGAFRTRILFEIANIVGHSHMLPSQLYFDRWANTDGLTYDVRASAEEYWGCDYNNPALRQNFDQGLYLGSRDSKDRIKNYEALVHCYGLSLVRGDAFRLFSGYYKDSHSPRNIRINGLDPGSEVRWIDWGDAIYGAFYNAERITSYIRTRLRFFRKYFGIELLDRIASLQDNSIKNIIQITMRSVYDSSTFTKNRYDIFDNDDLCSRIVQRRKVIQDALIALRS